MADDNREGDTDRFRELTKKNDRARIKQMFSTPAKARPDLGDHRKVSM